jgi:dTDP-glucose pyrophosphorylase
MEASEFISTIEKRTGLMVGCIEEIAYNNGWITKEKLLELAHNLRKTDYGKYLIETAQDHAF